MKEHELLEYDLGDKRHVKVEFSETLDEVKVTKTFDPENIHTEERQRTG